MSDRIQKSLNKNILCWLNCIELIWTQINEFEMFNEFEITRRTLKTVLRIVLRTCENSVLKTCINR